MKKILLLLFLFALGVFAQNPPVTASRIIRAASLPATCRVGDVYFKTAATVGTYQCLTTNNWTVMGGGGGGGATIPATTDIINGDGAGNGADSGIAVAVVALTSGTLGQFAATTSAQLATVISDESGTGLLVFGTNATLVTPTIASFVNATHTHQNAAGGGTLDGAAIAAGTVVAARLPNAGVFTGDVTTTFPAVTVAKVNGNTPGITCTTQFVRSIDTSARGTCASIANADLPTLTYTPSIFGGANLIPDSSGNVFAEPYTVLSGTAFFAYNIVAFADTSTLDCMYTRWNTPINYTTGATTFIIDWNTTATSGNAIWTLDYRDVSTATLAATTSQESLTVTTAASGTASARTQSSMTATASNFSAGDIIQIRVCRNGAGSDTIAATLAIHDIRFSYVGRP